MQARTAMIAAAALLAFNAQAALTFSEGVAGGAGGALDFTSVNSEVISPVSGSITNVRRAPLTLGEAGVYSALSIGGEATLEFADGASSFSFLWGSPDTYNFLDIVTSDGSDLTFSGTDLGALAGFSANGSNANTRLFTIGTNGGTLINSITFRSAGIAFEVASVAAIPEPSTLAMMLAGLAAVGFVARRRNP